MKIKFVVVITYLEPFVALTTNSVWHQVTSVSDKDCKKTTIEFACSDK